MINLLVEDVEVNVQQIPDREHRPELQNTTQIARFLGLFSILGNRRGSELEATESGVWIWEQNRGERREER